MIVMLARDRGLLLIVFHFYPFFPSLTILSTLKIVVIVFSGTIEARILKLGIRVENVLLCCGIEKRAHCFHSSLFSFVTFSGFSR